MRQCSIHRASALGQANLRGLVLALGFFVLGGAAAALWLRYAAHRSAAASDSGLAGKPGAVLSDSTRAVLQRLQAPVEIRLYALLDPAGTMESLRAFAGRVDELVSRYEQESDGKIKVTRCQARSNETEKAAGADGLKAFNIDKGDACFLGLAVVGGGRKESLPHLAPEWEPALESDLTRAILRLLEATAPARPAAITPPADPANIEEVKRAFPDLASVSVEEGTRVLRETALKDFQAAAKEMDLKLKEAEQRVVQARNGQSEGEQQAALKNLQQVQAEQTARLQQIAAQLQGRISALKQLKSPESVLASPP